jgi:L-lactate utilization protein LutB
LRTSLIGTLKIGGLMKQPVENYWQIRLKSLKETLEVNNFKTFIADDRLQAKDILEKQILKKTEAKSVSWGGSMTFVSTGIYESLKLRDDLEILDTFSKELPAEEMLEQRRQSLLVDLFITGTNAITEEGQLVNLDMYGNRVCGITFGPKNVVILVGRNKIVTDLEEAISRIKNYVAPTNAMRLDKETPCTKTSYCQECKSPDRICNTWTITEKSCPKGRINVILINEDLGL